MTHNLMISKNILYPLAVFGLIFMVFAVTIDFTSFNMPVDIKLILIYAGLFANFFTAVILIIDVFKNNLSTKYIWTLSFLLVGSLSGLFYLKNRKYYLNQLV